MDNLWKIGMFKYHFCIGIEEFEQAPIFREMWLTTLINVCNIVNRVLDFFLYMTSIDVASRVSSSIL